MYKSNKFSLLVYSLCSVAEEALEVKFKITGKKTLNELDTIIAFINKIKGEMTMKIEFFKRPTDSMLCILLGILLMGTSTMTNAKVNCNKNELAVAKKDLNILRNARKSNPGSVPDQEFRSASQLFINLSEECYIEEHGAGETKQLHPIDDGGVWAPGSGPDTYGELNLLGTKWGAGSPFPGGQDVPGPKIPGGNVTWSLMADGVSSAGEAPDNNTAIQSFPTYAPCFLSEVQTAFDAWSGAADISFSQVTDNGAPYNATGAMGDIRIGGHAFDGPGRTFAHGYFPPPNGNTIAGDIHFDIAENWSCNSGSGLIDFSIVLMHEVGHAIGLGHEDPPPTALMNPFYNPSITALLADDIMGVEQIYGTSQVILSLTLNFDWSGVGTTFSSTPLDIFADLTYVIGGGGSGQTKVFNKFGETALAFEFGPGQGCEPIFSGLLIGFMKCTSSPSTGPGVYYLGPPSLTEIEDKKPGALDASGTPIF